MSGAAFEKNPICTDPAATAQARQDLLVGLAGSADLERIGELVGKLLPVLTGALDCRLLPATMPLAHAHALQIPLPGTAKVLQCRFAGKAQAQTCRDAVGGTLAPVIRALAGALAVTRRMQVAEQSITALEQAEQLQRALYSIADQAGSGGEVSDMFPVLHRIVDSLMYARNFFIMLLDRAQQQVSFPYFVDLEDTAPPAAGESFPLDSLHGSMAWHLVHHARPLRGSMDEMAAQLGAEIKAHGPPAHHWLGVPMLDEHGVAGAIVVQSYRSDVEFSMADQELLVYVAHHVLIALQRRRAHNELGRRVAQRTRELRLANRVLRGQAQERARGERIKEVLLRVTELANASESSRDFYVAIHRTVGSLLEARNFYIALLSDDDQLVFPYSVDQFLNHRQPRQLGNGLTEYVLRQGRPLLADHDAITRLRARGDVSSPGTRSVSWLGVPLMLAGSTIGVLAVQSYDSAHRYTLHDQTLLTFVSYHIANAIERKRNADSLKRAYTEMEMRISERTAELDQANRDLRAEIERREQVERRLKHETLHDPLTGLPNRALLLRRLDAALLALHEDPSQGFAVLFLDLDRFKVINDSVGHLTGDSLLEEVGRRLQDAVEPTSTVARLGGDEFAILLHDVHNEAEGEWFARRMIDLLSAPVRVGGKELFTSASIGIALAGTHYLRGEELLRDADLAMYRAKVEGRNRHRLFDEQLRRNALELLELESDLRRAIPRREFEPWFQPIVDLTNNEVVGYEALMRWNHPLHGVVLPGTFLGVAEDSGLGEQLDWQIIERVCAVAPALTGNNLYVSVNLSARHFRTPDVAERIRVLLVERGVAPHTFRVEVVEHALLDDPEQAKRNIEAFRRAGIAVAIDDFGTGYSSLSYLHRFPSQTLKIDRSFVAGLAEPEREGSRAVIRAILALAGSLNMDTVAEGIETPRQRDTLLSLGCRVGQGFGLARPQPASHWLRGGERSEQSHGDD